MFSKFITVTFICALFAYVQSAPQFDQQFKQQDVPQSKYILADGHFHQDPNLEYNFEWVL